MTGAWCREKLVRVGAGADVADCMRVLPHTDTAAGRTSANPAASTHADYRHDARVCMWVSGVDETPGIWHETESEPESCTCMAAPPPKKKQPVHLVPPPPRLLSPSPCSPLPISLPFSPSPRRPAFPFTEPPLWALPPSRGSRGYHVCVWGGVFMGCAWDSHPTPCGQREPLLALNSATVTITSSELLGLYGDCCQHEKEKEN